MIKTTTPEAVPETVGIGENIATINHANGFDLAAMQGRILQDQIAYYNLSCRYLLLQFKFFAEKKAYHLGKQVENMKRQNLSVESRICKKIATCETRNKKIHGCRKKIRR